ncbi:MAG TPA: hypothetical protein VGR37_09490 [Longimicrobiaceae bacterium]|nr:hypothetical protein [Longimicrobiaceae bacterium]
MSLVLRLPEHTPNGVDGEIRRLVDLDWRRFVVPRDLPGEPAAALLEYFDPDLPPEAPRTCRTLVESSRFRGHGVMIETTSPEAAGDWCGFLIEYDERVRAVAPFARSRICLLLRGAAARETLAGGVALGVRSWDGVVGETDMVLWASYLLRDRGEGPIPRRVMASVIARLALWDPELALRLADEPNERVLAPEPILAEVARERGWSQGMDVCDTARWCSGALCEIEGQKRIHSAALAPLGCGEEVGHRVWAGQVGVLFPFVEERRRSLIDALGDRLIVPYRPHPAAEEIRDRRDLELSHVLRQVRQRPTGLPSWMMEALSVLVDIRNRIAHFETVPESLWLDRALSALLASRQFGGSA